MICPVCDYTSDSDISHAEGKPKFVEKIIRVIIYDIEGYRDEKWFQCPRCNTFQGEKIK